MGNVKACVYRDIVWQEDATEDIGRHATDCIDYDNTKPSEHLLKPTHYHQLNSQREQHVQDPINTTQTEPTVTFSHYSLIIVGPS